MAENKDMQYSYLRIRKAIGFLGLFLPLMLFIVEGEFLASLSHYYYTPSSIFFTSILSSFGLLLITYKGYEKAEGEWFSDNLVTFVGGLAVLIVVALPTCCSNSNNEVVEAMCQAESFPLFGHNTTLINTIHLFSAGLFLFCMGWMSFVQFPKSKKESRKTVNKIYKVSGILIWMSIAFLGLEFLLGFEISPYDVLILECVAVVAFGFSWLIKGVSLEEIQQMTRSIFGES